MSNKMLQHNIWDPSQPSEKGLQVAKFVCCLRVAFVIQFLHVLSLTGLSITVSVLFWFHLFINGDL